MSEEKKTNNQLTSPHICGLRLVSGEDIICVLSLTEDKSTYTMLNPALIFLKEKEGEPGKYQIAFSPFSPAAHGGQLSVSPDKVLALYAPMEDIAVQFRENYRHPGIKEEPKEAPPKFEG